MTREQEREYIRRAQREPQAFVHLYDRYYSRVHAYVRYRVSSPQDAQDVIAETFTKAIRELKRYRWRGEGSFAAWLFRIAHNLVVDYYRRHERDGPSLGAGEDAPEPADPQPSPEQILTQKERYEQVRAMIATLSPRRQEIITLRFYGGLRNREIANILGLDERTVASHLSRGLRDLQRRYTANVPSGATAESAV
jgi:RNA polymerase sigma-70 factor (ECF subfamily)